MNFSSWTQDIIGADYPIRDEKGQVVLTRKITAAHDISNLAGGIIYLENAGTGIAVSYKEIRDLINAKGA